MTALYDAIAFCINNIREKIDNDPRENKAALIIIQTDGAENQSTDYAGEEGRKKIKSMLDELDATDHWSVVFLGENIDKKVAMDLGVVADNIMSHKSNETIYAYASTTSGLDTYMKARKRGATKTSCFYKDIVIDKDDN